MVFESVSHPVLRTVNPADAVRFLRDREIYEAEIAERESTYSTSISPASYRISVDPIFLRSVHEMGCFDTIASDVPVDELTDEHIKQLIQSIAKNHTTREPNSAMIEEALKGLRMNMSIVDPRARTYQLALEFDTRMADIGYESFRSDNPKKAIELLTDCLFPIALRLQVKNDLDYIPKIRKNWKEFLTHAANMAEHIQRGNDSAARVSKSTVQQERKAKSNRSKGNGKKGGAKHEEKSDQKKSDRPLPKCLNSDCEEHHYMSDCKNTPADKKKELLRQFREKKRAEERQAGAKAVRTDTADARSRDSTLFRACFGRKVEETLCTDIGSDINLMPPSLFKDLKSAGATMEVVKFAKVRSYNLAVENDADGQKVFVTCDKQVTLDVQLFVRHGCTLWLRNITWYVATQTVPEPLLGRPVLFALGLDAEKTLAAASETHGGSVNVEKLLVVPDEKSTGSIARVIAEQGLYHESGSALDASHDVMPNSELGIDTKEDIDQAFERILNEAERNGCPDTAALSGLLAKHRKVFRCKLGRDPPARVEPMKVQIQHNTKPIMAKPRHYSTEQRRVICNFMTQAEDFGLMRKNTNATWASAPLLVPKPLQDEEELRYRLAFDLRAVNAVTVPLSWPLPHIDSEVADFKGKRFYALIDFISSYWQLPLHILSQLFHSVITPIGIFSPTRTLQGGRNSAANFQSRVEPCFSEIRQNLKAWLDDFILHARTFEELLYILDRFLTICSEHRLLVSAKKSSLFTTSVKWCGRIIDENGSRMDPRHIEGMMNASLPQTGDELSQFVNATQWMGHNIPDFAARVQPLRDILERAYDRAGRRTSKAISKVKLQDLAWGREHSEAMRSIQDSLKSTVSLSHFDAGKSVCIYTDASDQHWSAVITQCDKIGSCVTD